MSISFYSRLQVLLLFVTFSFSTAWDAHAASQQATGLISILGSNADRKAKADACRELARVGNAEAVPALISLLADENLSHMARYALETIPGPAVDQALRDSLPRLRGKPLVGVIGSIGVRRDPKATPALSSLLTHADPEVAQAAARALGNIATAEAVIALQSGLNSTAAAGKPAVYEGLFRAAEYNFERGHPKEAAVIYDQVRAQTAPLPVRQAALRGAILCRGPAGIPVLSQALRNSNREDLALFATALRMAQEMPGREVTRALVAELPGLPSEHQILVIQTLARRGDASAVPSLLQTVRTCEQSVRVAALHALGEFGKESVAPELLKLVDDRDPEIASASLETLAGLPGKQVDRAALKMLTERESKRQLLALDLLARRRTANANQELLRVAGNAEPEVRVAAVRTLGDLLAPEQWPVAYDLLLKAKAQPDLEAAEHALGVVVSRNAQPEQCAADLGFRMTQIAPVHKTALLRVLSGLGGNTALRIVRVSVDDSDNDVHSAAIRLLCNWSAAEVAPELLALARKAPNATDRQLCLRGYLTMAGRADLDAAHRLEMCRQAAPWVQTVEEKKLFLADLGALRSVDAFEWILPCLEDSTTKAEACTAALNVASKLLEGPDTAKSRDRLIEILERIARTNENSDLATRAQTLLEKARSK